MQIILPHLFCTNTNHIEHFVKTENLTWISSSHWWEYYFKQVKNELQNKFPEAKITRLYKGRPKERDYGTSKRIKIKFNNEAEEAYFLIVAADMKMKLRDKYD